MPASVGWAVDATRSTNPVVLWNPAKTLLLIISGDDFAAGTTDAGAVLSRFETTGLRCLSELNGWFSGVLVDLRNSSATIFNDRYGLGRIYYHDAGPDGLFFATEAKPLLAAHPATRHFDPRGLGEFIALGCVLQNRTLFKNVHVLPPGSAWTVQSDDRVKKERYFVPAEWEQQAQLEPPEYAARLAEAFGRATRRMFQSSERVGLSLTGGLDSRAVLAWAKAEPGTLPCYSFGGAYRDSADVRIARQLAQVCGQSHTTLRVANDFLAQYESLASESVWISDGTMDVTGAVELYVNRLASTIAPIRLTGNYGSEFLRHNVALRPRHLNRALYTSEFCRWLDEAIDTYNVELNCPPMTFIAFKQLPWHHYGRFCLERAVLTPRSPFLDNALIALAYRGPIALRTSPDAMLHLIAAGNPALARLRSDRAYRTSGSAMINTVANTWQKFTAKAEYAYDYGMPQWLARTDKLFSPLHLERLFLGRHKFCHFRVWYRDRLHDLLRNRVEGIPDERHGYRPGVIRMITNDHTAGRANHTLALHDALTLPLVEKLLLRTT